MLTTLPLICPEVRLGRIDEALLAEHELVGIAELRDEDITLGRAQTTPDRRRQSDLAVAAKREDG